VWDLTLGHVLPKDANSRGDRLFQFYGKSCTTTTTTTTGAPQCKGKADIVVVVDGSGSVGYQGWDLSKQATVALFDLVGADTRMATVVFSASSQLVTGLTQDKGKLTSDMQAKSFPMSTTNTAAGLKTARSELESNGVANSEKVIIVITDGRPNHPKSLVDDEVQRCKNNGYKMIFVPVGNNVPMADVERWASSPQLVIQASNFNSLATTVVAEIQKAACPSADAMLACLGRPQGWVRPYGDVSVSDAGAKECKSKCLGGGYTYFGFECPMAGRKVHCQCSNYQNSQQKLSDEFCQGTGNPLIHPHVHCVGPYIADGWNFGDAVVGSVYATSR
jgi:hypothetical protein